MNQENRHMLRQQQYNLFALNKGTAHAGWYCEKEDELGPVLTSRKEPLKLSA